MADLAHHQAIPNFSMQVPAQASNHHSRTRTISSSIFPTSTIVTSPEQASSQQRGHHSSASATQSLQAYTSSARTPSQATYTTTSTSATTTSPSMASYRVVSSDLRRTPSARSGGQPAGYVALMRRQKATVWCDRAQHEDPRLLAQQKAARLRAAQEVSGNIPGRLSTSGSGMAGTKSGVTAKIRHHGKANLAAYTPGDLAGGGVPMRLSATEVEGGEDEDDDSLRGSYGAGGNRTGNRRSGSGKSSLGSARGRGPVYRQSGVSSTGRWSGGNTPPEYEDDTPMPIPHDTVAASGGANAHKDYFSRPDPQNGRDGTQSAGSGSSGERADTVGDLTAGQDAARLASNSLLKSTLSREKSTKTPEELRRRGSVDERTMTLSTGRLYIANPDEDSD